MAVGIGIDFGTTNSALAWSGPHGADVARFQLFSDPVRVFRSLLFFEAEREWVNFRPPAWTGPEAIEQYIETGADGRLMQSMKTFLGSRSLRGTSVFGTDISLEHLVSLVVGDLWSRAVSQIPMPRRPTIVAGRPVNFAHAKAEEDNQFAVERLTRAFALAGFEDVEFVMEPVAAAYHYEAGLKKDELVLVADFGGGTTDFCLLRVGPEARNMDDDARILGTGGVGIAGDNFDARIVEHLVAPQLGRGIKYRSMLGKRMDLPGWIFLKLQRWNELSVLKTRENLKMLREYAATAEEPHKLEALVTLVEDDLGYELFRAVEKAKVALSSGDIAKLVFEAPGVHIEAALERQQFEGWIAPELEAIRATLDETLSRTGVHAHEVDTVFLTGGTARVPAVRKIFSERFTEGRLRSGDYLASVASGLAVRAANR